MLVSTIIQLARNLGLQPLAEGIETEEQRRFLVEHGCPLGQGFLFSRPVPATQIVGLYYAQRPPPEVPGHLGGAPPRPLPGRDACRPAPSR